SQLLRLLPELGERRGMTKADDAYVAHPFADSNRAHVLLSDTVSWVLRIIASKQSLFLGIDDLHEAHDDSLEVLGFLVRELRRMRVVVAAMSREPKAELSPRHSALFTEAIRDGRMIHLRGLSVDEVSAYLTRRGVSAELSDQLKEISGGNPLFL